MSVVISNHGTSNTYNRRRVVGWTAVVLSTAAACFWAFWGAVENFHEGWYLQTWSANVGLMLAQYLSPMLLFIALTLVAIFFPRLGGILHVALTLFAARFFNALTNTAVLWLIAPLVGLGALYWYGRAQPHKLAVVLAVALPLITLTLSAVGPAIRVSRRVDDGNLQARLVQGLGPALIWAPSGPGWPLEGQDWLTASQACRTLREDGLALASTPQNVWRLPSVDEAVRSMALHGQNSAGQWDGETAEASYEQTPDKESPLWDVHSQVIYWWTGTEVDEEKAYIIAYDGQVWPRSKQISQGYLGFRCVKQP